MLTNSCFYAFGDAFRVLHVHAKKHFNLGLEFSNVSHDPDKIILTTHLTLYQKVKKVYFVKVKSLQFHLINLNTEIIYCCLSS